ncbi:host cell division inhibitory peptide Kil [Salmonella enterica]|nr:host cell division inhibitory peptide Kil [Salmonella enterica]
MSDSLRINHNKLRAAQNKALIARFIGDAFMWMQAGKQMKEACGYPLYRRSE